MTRPASYTWLQPDEWDGIISRLEARMSPCTLCPRRCKVDRLAGEQGFCGAPAETVISSIFPHHGEEPPISGTGGSGTIFFTHCTLRCIFCQNHQISQGGEGRPYSPEELASGMLDLQRQGCHNINLVTATHFLPGIVRALKIAADQGLSLPIVYNCGGYELPEVMALLSGIVDIYLPDMKYGADGPAKLLSSAPDYVQVNRSAIREMFRQTGPLRIDSGGIAWKGLCIRHLVLPEGYTGTKEVLDYLSATYDPHDIFISLMAQYRPLFRAASVPEINRTVSFDEYEPLKNAFVAAGFQGFFQEVERMDEAFVIDFTKRKSERLGGPG